VALRPAVALFYVMAALVFFQLLTGGLRVFGFIDELTHIGTGIITFIIAVISLTAAALAKPRYRPAVSIAGLMVVLIFLQGLLGLSFRYVADPNGLIVLHFANALIIYGLAMSGVIMAMRWSKMVPPQVAPPKQP
jgi:heme A synthase